MIISNSKSVYKLKAHQWTEVSNEETGDIISSANDFEGDFMLQSSTFYKISFVGERCQFCENSVLNVSRCLYTSDLVL